MKIRVLGCSGAIAAGSKTTAFLVDDDLLIDAGSGVGDLSLDELIRIDTILLTHSHLDHVLAVALLADSVIRRRTQSGRPPIDVHALPETIQALKANVFNGAIWPDFTRLPNADRPVLRFVPFAVGDCLALGTRHIEVLSARHTVPAVGFAIESRADASKPSPQWVFSGDTGPNPALWQRLRNMQVATLVIEAAFRDDEHSLADVSGHLCPSLLGRELAQLDGVVDVRITHIKPGEIDAVMTEIAALNLPHRISALEAGQEVLIA